MGSTVSNSRNSLFQMQDTAERLQRDIDGLLKERKSLGLFLKIKAEKAEIEALKEQAKNIKDSAENQAMHIVSKASKEAEEMKEQAASERDTAKKYAQKIVREAIGKMERSDKQQELSTKRAHTVTMMEDAFKRAVGEHDSKVEKFKSKASVLAKSILDIVGE